MTVLRKFFGGILMGAALLAAAGCAKPKTGVENMSYEIVGQGDQALVFIHCWSCNKEYWKNQIEPLAKKYRLVLIDLPGHGKSVDVELPQWTVPGMAQAVEGLIRKLGLKNAVLVGSSMGGPIALQIAGDMPEAVKGIVCVDTLHNVEVKMPKEMLEQATVKMKEDYSKAVKAFMPMMFTPASDPKLVEWVKEQAVTSNPKGTIPLMQSFGALDAAALMKRVKAPIRYINATPYGPMSIPTAPEVNKKYADFEVIEMEGVGHFPMLEKPTEFNTKFQQALDGIALASSRPAPN